MSARRGEVLRLFAILLVFAVLLSTGHFAEPAAAANEPSVKNAEAESVKVRELLGLLADPQVQAWLEKQRNDHAAAAPAPDIASSSPSHYFGTRIAAIREHIADLGRTVPDLPAQFARACDLFRADLQGRGAPRVISFKVSPR
jgi:moderate conductance mechanosensitive channel